MSLALRMLLAFALVASFVTAMVGLATRGVARRQVEHGFEQRLATATAGARGELLWEARSLASSVAPLCRDADFVDATLADLERVRGDVTRLSAARREALRRAVPAHAKELRLDALALATASGDVIGAARKGRVGRREAALGRLGETHAGVPRARGRGREASLEVHCSRTSPGASVRLVAARRVAPILERVGDAYGVRLSVPEAAPAPSPKRLQRRMRVDGIDGLEVTATVSREPLLLALRQIDRNIVLTGAIAVLLSIALAVLLSTRLSRPIVELAHQTRQVMGGRPRPVKTRGGRELVQLASTFNTAIAELSAVRGRLARTERIAARREVARRVAHEIKNPLAPIRMAVETLRRLRAREAPEFDEYFDEATATVLGEVHRIKTIVDEFTKYARLRPPTFAEVDLREVADGVVSLHDASDAGGVAVTLEGGELPIIQADADQLVQVLTNLVQNGIDAAKTAETREARVVLRREGSAHVAVRVEDGGPGVAPEVVARLFEPYVTTKVDGTGLGLAIVQTIVHEHGGEIVLLVGHAKPPGALPGACFEIVLPVAGPPLLEQAPAVTGRTH